MADPTILPGELWTIGHWTCPPGSVLETLASAAIGLLADVRKTPASRASPQFNTEQLSSWLPAAGIGYVHLPELAGRRPRSKHVDPATNAGWQNASFRNYADYTLTPDYEAGLAHLSELAYGNRVVIMCGEPMPWRCHRLLIANTLTARGWVVTHLMTNARPQQHRLGQWAPPQWSTRTASLPTRRSRTTWGFGWGLARRCLSSPPSTARRRGPTESKMATQSHVRAIPDNGEPYCQAGFGVNPIVSSNLTTSA